MKKRILSLCLIVLIVAVCSSVLAPAAADDTVKKVEDNAVSQSALDTRFLNMLNHNYVYNSDFDCADDIINNSIAALIDLRDKENDNFIAERYVKGFVFDMYGVEITDMSELNADFSQMDGFVYIIPRGMTSYSHEIISVDQNDDGTYTVVSDVVVDCHDGEPETFKAVSLFVKNSASAFGYNIVYSNIADNASDI